MTVYLSQLKNKRGQQQQNPTKAWGTGGEWVEVTSQETNIEHLFGSKYSDCYEWYFLHRMSWPWSPFYKNSFFFKAVLNRPRDLYWGSIVILECEKV